MPNVLDNESLYNVIKLNGVNSPGKVTLSGHDRVTKWDVQTAPFMNGSTIWLKGVPAIEFTATFELLRDLSQGIDDFATWDAFQKVIESSLIGNSPKALPIYHPDLSRNDIKSVVRAKVGGMKYDGKGGAVVVVNFQEYRRPRPQQGIVASKPAVDPNADLKAKVKELTTQYQNTPWG